MLVSDFDYSLPPELIAQKPLPHRDDSRMMVVLRREGKILHSRFKEFPTYIKRGDVLVLNNTKVLPAKVWGQKDGKDIEFLLLKEKEKNVWEALCRPARRVREGDVVSFRNGQTGKIKGVGAEGRRVLSFAKSDVITWLNKTGYPPLPPYIKRPRQALALRNLDLERYQTVFAKKKGAIAAPTAGLHFTRSVLNTVLKKGAETLSITLQVGLATFQPVRVDRVEDHKMLEETYSVSRTAAASINRAKQASRSVIAVGTTVVRTLESAWVKGAVRAEKKATSLFIFPGYDFKVVDGLLTNFHLPKSTLLMMIAAFAGTELIKQAYQEAVRQRYRFYSYGDCMLIL